MGYTKHFDLRMEEVDPEKRLRLPNLLLMAQQMAVAHVEAMDLGHDKTLDRGFLWVVARQHYVIRELPCYADEIDFETHPGETMAFVYPRHYALSRGGKTLIKGIALWSLISMKDRKPLFPKATGIHILGEKQEGDLPFPMMPKAPELDHVVDLEAKWSLCDLNGHINNVRYVDFCMDLIPLDFLKKKPVKELWIDYKKEIKLGESVQLHYGYVDEAYWFLCEQFELVLCF